MVVVSGLGSDTGWQQDGGGGFMEVLPLRSGRICRSIESLLELEGTIQ